jgi:hypothetical protein
MRGEIPTTTILFEKAGDPYVIEFPIIYVHKKRGENELRMDVSARIIHDRIKSLLIMADLNILEFSQVMMGFLLIPDKFGYPQQFEEYVLEHKNELPRGTFNISYQLTDGKS